MNVVIGTNNIISRAWCEITRCEKCIKCECVYAIVINKLGVFKVQLHILANLAQRDT